MVIPDSMVPKLKLSAKQACIRPPHMLGKLVNSFNSYCGTGNAGQMSCSRDLISFGQLENGLKLPHVFHAGSCY